MSEINVPFAAKPLNTSSIRLSGSKLIEASAGTGKTYTIAMLYLRLILGHEQDQVSTLPSALSPREILVVTFTEAATKELSDRIRQRIAQAVDVFDLNYVGVNQFENSDLVAFRDAQYPDKSQWPQCQKKLMLALELMDEAAISTIHSWCYQMLREHAFDSGSLFDQSLRKDESDLFQEAVRDYWRIFVYPLGAAHMTLFQHYFQSPEALKDVVKYTYRLADSIASSAYSSLEQLPADIFSNIKQMKNRDWQTIINTAVDFLQKIKRKEIESSMKINSVTAVINAVEKLPLWLNSDDLFPEKFKEKDISKANKIKRLSLSNFPELADPKYISELEIVELITQLESYFETLKTVRSNIIAHASKWVFERVKQAKAQSSELGFDELIKSLHAALQNDALGKLKQTIAEQFPAVMIDEFQDTDNLQYEIFDQIYDLKSNQQNKCLLLIGDPKQAIYSFRGGDIFTYLKASFAVGENKYTLDKNYRSTQAMVEAVNYIFGYAETNHGSGAFAIAHNGQALLPFEPVFANGLKESFQIDTYTQPALTLLTEPDDSKFKVDDVAASVATQVIDLLNKAQQGKASFTQTIDNQNYNRPVRASDIAILVNGKTEANRIREALNDRRLRSYYVSDRGSILNTIEAHEMLIWLKAVAEPTQVANLRAALASSILDFSIQALYKNIQEDSHLDQIFEDFTRLHNIWKQQGVFPMLKTLLFDYQVPKKLLDSSENKERVLTNILHIAELLQEASLKIDGMQNLINYYEDLLTNETEDDEFLLPRLESEKGLVQIVTFHKSKGLQYPIVFIPYGLKPPMAVKDTDLITFHNENFERLMCLSGTQEQIQTAEQESLAEKIRMLYVAVTRAQFASYIGVARENSWYKSALAYLLNLQNNKDSINSQLTEVCNSCPEIAVEPFISANETQYVGEPKLVLGHARNMSKPIPETWQFHSYSSIQYEQVENVELQIQSIQEPQLDIAALGKEEHHFFEDGLLSPINSSQNTLKDLSETLEESLPELNIYNFYKGATAGTFLHNILEWCCLQGFADLLENRDKLYEHIKQQSELQAWSHYNEVLCEWFIQLISSPMSLDEKRDPARSEDSVSLVELELCVPEMEFLFNANDASLKRIDELVQQYCFTGQSRPNAEPKDINGMFKGFIDLTFVHNDKYYVLDYKSNFLGDSSDDYTLANMHDSIVSHRYDLQYVIYLVALHRMLKNRIENYRYEDHIGGAIYYFLRGVENESGGVFTTKPPFELIKAVDEIFLGEALQCVSLEGQE